MQVSSNKNNKLIHQFPFITEILTQRMEPLKSGAQEVDVDNLTIKVQKADGDLLFRQADNVGLGDGSVIISSAENRKNQVMKQGEYIFAVNKENVVVNQHAWPRNDEAARNQYLRYGGAVLWKTISADKRMMSDPIWDKICYLVWVTVQTWHNDTQNNDWAARCGECLERNIVITIYGAPECGFKELYERSSIWSNLRLNTKVFTNAMVNNHHDLIQILGCLWELCKFFQDEVWDGGMKQIYEKFDLRGASGQFGPCEVLAFEMCGYHRVMLQNRMCWISFQLRPGAVDMYVLSQDGTLPQLRELVRGMIKMWIMNPECRTNFKPNASVFVM